MDKKGIVIYYSQTGNTQKIAQAIHRGMSQRLERCDLRKLNEIDAEALQSYDLIGLGSPVWNGRPSINMDSFIADLRSLEGKQTFFFCTHGAIPGPIISNVSSDLSARGLTVIGWANWYGSVTLPVMPKPYYTDGHPDALDLHEAERFGIEMAERSLRISQGATGLIPKLPGKDESAGLYGRTTIRVYPEYYDQAKYSPFRVDEAKCTGCHLCADNCPTKNIDGDGPIPVFKTAKCRRCWYCEQICPSGAIEFDWPGFQEAMARYSGSGQDERLMVLSEAEKTGRFRRLIPANLVDENKLWYQTSSHPRVKVP